MAPIAARTSAAPQTDSLGNLAFSLGESIVDATKADEIKPRIRVENFRELDGGANELGVELANQVSDLLRQSSTTSLRSFFYVLDRISDPSPDAYNQPCDEKHRWPDILVKGSTDELAGQLSVRVTANRTSNGSLIFDRTVSLPNDPAVEAARSKRLSAPSEADIWLQPGYDPDKDEELKAPSRRRTESFTPPSCIYCPRVEYVEGAAKAQIQGEILMRVLVGKNGEPLKIVVVQGLPCGMNRAALKAVGSWRLHPAKASDGTPIEVWQEVTITYQFY